MAAHHTISLKNGHRFLPKEKKIAQDVWIFYHYQMELRRGGYKDKWPTAI